MEQGKKGNVSPQDQAMYDRVMVLARGLIFGDPKKPQVDPTDMVLQKLASAKDQIGQEIGDTAANIMATVRNGIAKQGKQVPPAILFHATREVVADIMEIAIAGELVSPAEKMAVTKEALMGAMVKFKEHESREAKAPVAPQGIIANARRPA